MLALSSRSPGPCGDRDDHNGDDHGGEDDEDDDHLLLCVLFIISPGSNTKPGEIH